MHLIDKKRSDLMGRELGCPSIILSISLVGKVVGVFCFFAYLLLIIN